MGENLKYGEFEFPSDKGFSGSAGTQSVKGYMRGGRVKGKSSTHEPTTRNKDHTKGKGMSKKNMPKGNAKRRSRGVKAKGGVVKKQLGGQIGTPQNVRVSGMGDAPGQQKMGYMGDDSRDVEVGDVKVSLPRKKGGRANKSLHDKMKAHGKKMGYKSGGYVAAKDTSSEFKGKREKQDTMDSGVQPARRGGNARSSQEKEAGGTGRLKPGLKKGGRVAARHSGAGAVDNKSGKANRRRAVAKPRTPAMKGGHMKKAKGGKVCAVGKGGARQKMPATVKAKGGLARAAGDKMSHPKGKGRKPYTGYNQQPGGSGNEDARYMNVPMGKKGAARSR